MTHDHGTTATVEGSVRGLIPTHPVHIPCGRKPEYREKTQEWSVDGLFSHKYLESVVRNALALTIILYHRSRGFSSCSIGKCTIINKTYFFLACCLLDGVLAIAEFKSRWDIDAIVEEVGT